MPVYGDLVHQTTTGTGTGNLTLTVVNGKRTFLAAFGTGGSNTFDYYVSHQTAAEWERGTGHESGGALVRDTVLASSNAGAAVNFSAGTKDVTNDQPADKRADKTSVGDAAPANPTPGVLWWESDTGILWLYYNDGTSSQWVEIGGGSGVNQTYVDAQVALKVAKAGDTMTGTLVGSAGIAVGSVAGDNALPVPAAGIVFGGGNQAGVSNYTASGNATTAGVVKNYADSNDGYRRYLDIAVLGSTGGAQGTIRFSTANGTTTIERMRIDQDGNVIVTANPTVALGLATKQMVDAVSVAAAPLDALAYNGMQVNGQMDVSQERGTTAVGMVAGSAYNIADVWKAIQSSTGAGWASAQINIGGVAAAGIQNAIYIGTNGAATFGAGDYAQLYQYIEGYRVARLGWGTANAQPITIGFWIYSGVAGTMCVAIRNSADNRSYISNVTINAAGTWEYKTVTIPGDTAGSWVKDNGVGLKIVFAYTIGATYQTTAGVWTAGVFSGSPQISNLFTTATNVYLTGVVVLPGTQSPSAARSINAQRPFDQELDVCKRYYRKIGGEVAADVIVQGYAVASSNSVTITLPLSPAMRAAPAVSRFGTWADTNVLSTSYYPSKNSVGWQTNAAAAGTINSYGNIGGLICDARL